MASYFPDTDSKIAARAVIEWSAAFGASKGLNLEDITQFQNVMMLLVSKELKEQRIFTHLFCSWRNGAIERLTKNY